MDAKLVVIDYEFCSYNYRAFDIANHFQEWMYDYTNKSYPYYYIAKDKFPSKETRLDFLKTYLDETLVGSSRALSITHESRQQQAEALQREVEAFFIVPNLLWALWSMAQSVSTKITFGYWVKIPSKFASNLLKISIFVSVLCRGTNAVLLPF